VVQVKLDQMARESGRPSDELGEDALIGYFNELAYTREMLERRYADPASVVTIPREVFFELRSPGLDGLFPRSLT
jgi:hypothetical protein